MTDMLMVLMASFLGLMLIGLPVAWSMIAAMLVWIIYGGKWMFLPIVAERIYQGMDVFVLMVIALIILTGLPIGALMAATLIPGLLVGAAQMVQARVHDFPRVDMERSAMFSGQLLIILGCGADPNDAGVQHCAVDPWHVH